MKVVITNAGDDGLLIADFLERWLSQNLTVTNVTTKECWLVTERYGPLTHEVLYPYGEVSFDINFAKQDPDWGDYLVHVFTKIFKGQGLHFVFPEINFHFTT